VWHSLPVLIGVALVAVGALFLGDWMGFQALDRAQGWIGRQSRTEVTSPSPDPPATLWPDRLSLPPTLSAGEYETSLASVPAAPRLLSFPPATWTDAQLEASLTGVLSSGVVRAGRVAVVALHLPTGATAAMNAHLPLAPASVFKLGVLVEAIDQVEEGWLTLDDPLRLLPQDWIGGAGVLQGRIGAQIPVAEALRLMIGVSDNIAAAALLRHLGMETVASTYTRHGLVETSFTFDGGPDTTTAWDTAALLVMIATGQLASPDLTRYMLDLLAQWQPSAWIRDALPPDVVVAHKSGQLPGIRNDAALVFGPGGPYVLVVLTNDLIDDAEGELVIGVIADLVHEHFVTTYPSGLFALD
jgi:beta-lactamase class A